MLLWATINIILALIAVVFAVLALIYARKPDKTTKRS
jgi:hypothetical protein